MKTLHFVSRTLPVFMLSFATTADVYTVEVALTSTRDVTLLNIAETSPMVAPELVVSKDTIPGANCVINDETNALGYDGREAFPANSLCPLQTGNKAQFQISGFANAYFHAKAYADQQVESGIQFDFAGFDDTYRLSGSGTYDFTMGAVLTSIDPDAAASGVLAFTYNFEAYYQ